MKLKAKWSLESQQDLMAYYNIDWISRQKELLIAKLHDPNYDPASMDEFEMECLKTILEELNDCF